MVHLEVGAGVGILVQLVELYRQVLDLAGVVHLSPDLSVEHEELRLQDRTVHLLRTSRSRCTF